MLSKEQATEEIKEVRENKTLSWVNRVYEGLLFRRFTGITLKENLQDSIKKKSKSDNPSNNLVQRNELLKEEALNEEINIIESPFNGLTGKFN